MAINYNATVSKETEEAMIREFGERVAGLVGPELDDFVEFGFGFSLRPCLFEMLDAFREFQQEVLRGEWDELEGIEVMKARLTSSSQP